MTTSELKGSIPHPSNYTWLMNAVASSQCQNLHIFEKGTDHGWTLEYEPNPDLRTYLVHFRNQLQEICSYQFFFLLALFLVEIHLVWNLFLNHLESKPKGLQCLVRCQYFCPRFSRFCCGEISIPLIPESLNTSKSPERSEPTKTFVNEVTMVSMDSTVSQIPSAPSLSETMDSVESIHPDVSEPMNHESTKSTEALKTPIYVFDSPLIP